MPNIGALILLAYLTQAEYKTMTWPEFRAYMDDYYRVNILAFGKEHLKDSYKKAKTKKDSAEIDSTLMEVIEKNLKKWEKKHDSIVNEIFKDAKEIRIGIEEGAYKVEGIEPWCKGIVWLAYGSEGDPLSLLESIGSPIGQLKELCKQKKELERLLSLQKKITSKRIAFFSSKAFKKIDAWLEQVRRLSDSELERILCEGSFGEIELPYWSSKLLASSDLMPLVYARAALEYVRRTEDLLVEGYDFSLESYEKALDRLSVLLTCIPPAIDGLERASSSHKRIIELRVCKIKYEKVGSACLPFPSEKEKIKKIEEAHRLKEIKESYSKIRERVNKIKKREIDYFKEKIEERRRAKYREMIERLGK